jgi:hypothetical protein
LDFCRLPEIKEIFKSPPDSPALRACLQFFYLQEVLNYEYIVRVMRQLIIIDKFFANWLLLVVHNFNELNEPDMSGMNNKQWQSQEMNL